MTRSRRIKSGTDVYHVVSRGNNQSDIFLKDEDKRYFFALMKREADKLEIKIYAYCIMTNHYHLLIKSDLKILSSFMQELNLKYAIYYNCKYEHTGHAFQGRFFSSTVETEAYLVSCVRYIHNNPVKANMVSDILMYSFSSANEYVESLMHIKTVEGVISEEVLSLIKSRFKNEEKFLEFHNHFDNQDFIDVNQEKEEHDFQRIKYCAKKYLKKNDIKNYKILYDVPFLRTNFVKVCSEETLLPKRKIEKILKILAKSV